MSDTPISDAVTEAQAEGGLVEWQITVSSHSKTGYSAKLQAQGECFMVTEFKYLSESDNLSWQRGSHADAATALRLIADALKPADDAVSDSLQRVNASVEKYAADLRAEFGDSQYHIHWGAVFSRIGEIISQAREEAPDE